MAERKCLAKQSGKYPWSPDLHREGLALRYWRQRRSAFYSVDVNDAELSKIANRVGIANQERDWLSPTLSICGLSKQRETCGGCRRKRASYGGNFSRKKPNCLLHYEAATT